MKKPFSEIIHSASFNRLGLLTFLNFLALSTLPITRHPIDSSTRVFIWSRRTSKYSSIIRNNRVRLKKTVSLSICFLCEDVCIIIGIWIIIIQLSCPLACLWCWVQAIIFTKHLSTIKRSILVCCCALTARPITFLRPNWNTFTGTLLKYIRTSDRHFAFTRIITIPN